MANIFYLAASKMWENQFSQYNPLFHAHKVTSSRRPGKCWSRALINTKWHTCCQCLQRACQKCRLTSTDNVMWHAHLWPICLCQSDGVRGAWCSTAHTLGYAAGIAKCRLGEHEFPDRKQETEFAFSFFLPQNQQGWTLYRCLYGKPVQVRNKQTKVWQQRKNL